MGTSIWRVAAGIALAAGMSVSTAGMAIGHDQACEILLRDSPIESARLPEGWKWDYFTLEQHGAPSFQVAIDADGFAVSLELSCVSDPEGLLQRLEDLRIAADNDKIGVVIIGDESHASREFKDFPTIRWRHGDIVGLLRAAEDVDYGAMEEFALAVDALLP